MGTHQDQLRGFAKYNGEFNCRLYEQIAGLTDIARKEDLGAFFGSIHGTLNHILLADRIWLGRFARAIPTFRSLATANLVYEFSSLDQQLFDSFDELRVGRRETDELIYRWVEELEDAVLAQTMRYNNSKEHVREHPVWLAATHMFNHQTHHRGQLTTLLFQLGYDPGTTDYIAYLPNSR